MSLYAIGDFHLALGMDKPMDVFGEKWANHTQKLKTAFAALKEDDVSVLCGDLSWAMSLESAREDFLFVDSLPGKKLIIKGNHDYWWSTVAKAERFFAENGIETIKIIHNNSFEYGDYALCGTRGWFFEEEKGGGHDKKIMRREIMRLEASLNSAGERQKLVFLHYPPVYMNYECPEILELLKKHEVRLCCYGHIHGKACRAAFNGWKNGTQYRLVSADFVDFTPIKLLD